MADAIATSVLLPRCAILQRVDDELSLEQMLRLAASRFLTAEETVRRVATVYDMPLGYIELGFTVPPRVRSSRRDADVREKPHNGAWRVLTSVSHGLSLPAFDDNALSYVGPSHTSRGIWLRCMIDNRSHLIRASNASLGPGRVGLLVNMVHRSGAPDRHPRRRLP